METIEVMWRNTQDLMFKSHYVVWKLVKYKFMKKKNPSLNRTM